MDDADRAAHAMALAMASYERQRWQCHHHAAPIHAHCTDCGGDIGEARRQAYPSASRCVECQTIAERRHG